MDAGLDTAANLVNTGLEASKQGIGSAAGAVGESAAQSAAAAGASSAAASGAGAAAGTAVGGPLGTVLGFAVGAFSSSIVKAVIVVLLIIYMMFSSLPSILFEKTIDMLFNDGPIAIRQEYNDLIRGEYEKEIERIKEEIEEYYDQIVKDLESGWPETEADYEYWFVPSEEEFLEMCMENADLIVSMFEIAMDDWRDGTLEDFIRVVINEGMFVGSIDYELVNEERHTSYTVKMKPGPVGVPTAMFVRIIHIEAEFELIDNSIENIRGLLDLEDDWEYLKAVEMAHNTKVFFGEAILPPGGISGGGDFSYHPDGGTNATYPGGGTHNSIRNELNNLENQEDFFGGDAIIPLPSGTWSITSEFGPRNYAPDPIHTGLDFGAAAGTSIYAAMDGVVLAVYNSSTGFGKHIVLYHGGDITTMYAHMSAFGPYEVGDYVPKGSVIGYVGKTGLSTGNHLHFEYQVNGAAKNPRLILPL